MHPFHLQIRPRETKGDSAYRSKLNQGELEISLRYHTESCYTKTFARVLADPDSVVQAHVLFPTIGTTFRLRLLHSRPPLSRILYTFGSPRPRFCLSCTF